MMAELEIDQSNLPRVQEVRQCFAVLEDGVLAHNLQEQEIEHYYTTNIQKNQLVQNDIRVAKRLQDEEEEHRVQQSDSLRHASRQIEEQDFEYARVIQEELQRCAEEARRREEDDEELAKQMQEEEEQIVRRRSSRVQEVQGEGNTSESSPLHPHQHTLGEERYPSTTTRWQCSTSHSRADLTGPQTLSPRGAAAQRNTTSWSNQGHTDSVRPFRSEARDSDDSDSAFAEELSVAYQRLCERFKTTPHQQRASFHQSQERQHRSLRRHSSHTDRVRGWEEAGREGGEEQDENSDLQRRRPRTRDRQRSHSEEYEDYEEDEEAHGSSDHDSSLVEFADRWCRRSESVRLPDGSRRTSRDLTRTWSYKDSPDKRVHFREDNRSSHGRQDESSQVWKMLGHILLERGVPVRFGGSRAPLQIGPQSRDSQVLHGSEVSCSDSRPLQRDFQRAAATRHSFHGDIRERRRLSHRENSGRDHREDRDRRHDNGELYEISSRGSHLARRERRGSGRRREHRHADDGESSARDYRVRRTTSERRPVHRAAEERLNSEEEQEVERRAEPPRRRALQHSQSFSSSFSSSRASARRRSRHGAAGALLQPEPNRTSLDLGDLQQVLEDEELARKLQEEEDDVLRTNSQVSPSRSYPHGDFRVAQVAQDEEIARFIQKQEIKSKRLSRELEGPASWREHRAMISHHDRRAGRERHVPRERLDSEGLPSPTEDCPPENQPPSPVSPIPQAQQIRNIAEELDPTFQARRQGTDGLQVGPTGPTCQSPVTGEFVEEPTFIPPTKRQADKPGRSKAKEKKENCKQQ